jgi:hypothetical protein
MRLLIAEFGCIVAVGGSAPDVIGDLAAHREVSAEYALDPII